MTLYLGFIAFGVDMFAAGWITAMRGWTPFLLLAIAVAVFCSLCMIAAARGALGLEEA